MDDDALQAIYPVFSALVVATVLRVFVFAVEVHTYVLLDMIYETMRQARPMRKCVRRVLDRLYIKED